MELNLNRKKNKQNLTLKPKWKKAKIWWDTERQSYFWMVFLFQQKEKYIISD